MIGLQAFDIGVFCKLCMVADPAAIVLAVCAILGARTLSPRMPRVLAVAPAIAAVVGVLAVWTQRPTDDGPSESRKELLERVTRIAQSGVYEAPPSVVPPWVLEAQTPDAVTIVEVVDFECPFCREMQKRLAKALEQTRVPVRVVRKMMPLPMHRGAVPAAIAYCCADAQGHGEEMAKALFAAPPETLTPYGCQQMAIQVGCDLEQFKKDVPAAIQRVQREYKAARAAGVRGLPTMFIGHDRHKGVSLSVDELVAEIESHAP